MSFTDPASTHRDHVAFLRWALEVDGWACAEELLVNPRTRQRADVVGISPKASNVSLVAFEVKVTRGDFLAEVRSRKYEGYADVLPLYFAAPSGVWRQIDEVPAVAGVIDLHLEKETISVARHPQFAAYREPARAVFDRCVMAAACAIKAEIEHAKAQMREEEKRLHQLGRRVDRLFDLQRSGQCR